MYVMENPDGMHRGCQLYNVVNIEFKIACNNFIIHIK